MDNVGPLDPSKIVMVIPPKRKPTAATTATATTTTTTTATTTTATATAAKPVKPKRVYIPFGMPEEMEYDIDRVPSDTEIVIYQAFDECDF